MKSDKTMKIVKMIQISKTFKSSNTIKICENGNNLATQHHVNYQSYEGDDQRYMNTNNFNVEASNTTKIHQNQQKHEMEKNHKSIMTKKSHQTGQIHQNHQNIQNQPNQHKRKIYQTQATPSHIANH